MYKRAFAILSESNLLHNLATIKNHAPHTKVIAMIKANAYGHGLREVAIRLEKHVYSLGVASIEEAMALRKINIKAQITLMSGIYEPEDLIVAARENFQVVFHEQTQLDWLKNITLTHKLTAWLKIDTGMGRLGFTPKQAQMAYNQLSQNIYIEQPIGIMSHLACSDEANHPLTKAQVDCFQQFVKDKPNNPKSLFNSAAILTLPNQNYDIIRPGLALYGISPIEGITGANLNLKPVMTLQARLIAIKRVTKNSTLGYGARFSCPNDMTIGVVSIGYGDGYPRSAQDGTPVLINNQICPLIGRVSMDMITVDLTNCPSAQVGNIATLWGQGLPIETVAPHISQGTYDMLTAVQSRVKFYWEN
jgi:alanine racemase